MEAFKNSMAPLLAAVEERFRKLNIDGIPTEVRKCSEEYDTKVLTDELLAYTYEYRQGIQSKAYHNNTPLLH